MNFILVLPLMILFFAMIVVFGRLYWGYQSVVAGLRDASRHVARIAPIDICLNSGSLDSFEATLKPRIETDTSGRNALPSGFVVDSVDASKDCSATGTFWTTPPPIATGAASVSLPLPLGHPLNLFGAGFTSVTTGVSDTARIYRQ